jgi:hypothetical protein
MDLLNQRVNLCINEFLHTLGVGAATNWFVLIIDVCGTGKGVALRPLKSMS